MYAILTIFIIFVRAYYYVCYFNYFHYFCEGEARIFVSSHVVAHRGVNKRKGLVRRAASSLVSAG